MTDEASETQRALVRLLEDALDGDILDTTWLSLTALLLTFCREHQPIADDWSLLGGQPFAAIRTSQIGISAAVRRADQIYLASDEPISAFPSVASLRALSKAVQDELRNALESWTECGGSPDFLAVAVANAAANSIDEIYGATYLEKFRSRHEVTITPGLPYPVTVRNPAPWLGEASANTSPRRLPDRDLARTTHLRLGSVRPMSVRFVLDFQVWNRLGPLGASGELIVAVGQPNVSLDEFDLRFPDDRGVYRNLGPRDPLRQAEDVLAQLEAAGQAGADLIVFPEYCLNPATLDAIEPRVPDLSAAPTMVIAGFCETAGEDELLNQAWLALPGVPAEHVVRLVVPPKVSGAPFVRHVADSETGEMTEVVHEEDIRTGSEIRVYVTRQWTIAVAICRDALDASILRQLAHIGVNLLVVPAMSARTATMLDLVHGVRASAQAFVVLANGPGSWAGQAAGVEALPQQRHEEYRIEAAFAGPYARVEGATVIAPPAATDGEPASVVPSPDARGFWMFSSGSRQLTWHDCNY